MTVPARAAAEKFEHLVNALTRLRPR
jgi:hypothetical protein